MNKTNDPFVLKMIDLFVKPFLGKDLNYPLVRELLKLKLVLDKRRVPKINAAKKAEGKEPKESNRSMLLACGLYAFMGLFIASFQLLKNLFVANIFGYGALIFMLLTVYIGEYSAVLLDTTEKFFFGSLPVGKRELKVAKDIHIAYYIGMIAGSMMLPSVVVAVIMHGILYGSVFLSVGIIIIVFCLHLSGGLYFLLLKIFSGEKLKDILNTFQVFVTVAIILGYQILPRVINLKDLSSVDFDFNYVLFLIPSAWFASLPSILFEGKFDLYYFGLAAAGLISVISIEIVYKRKVMKEFDKELEKLTEEAKENKSLSRFERFLCKSLSKDRQEKAFMELVLIRISRDRNLKLKLYPQLVNAMIFPVLILFTQIQNGGIGKLLQGMKTGPFFLALYMVGLSSAGIYALIGQSENDDGKVFYQVLPIENLSKCIRAGIKVVIFKYLTPLFLFMAVLFTALSGTRILFDVVVIYAAFLFVTSLMIRIAVWELPFSTELKTTNAGYGILMFFMSFAISGGIAFVHFMFLKTFPAKATGLVLLIMGNLILWKFMMNKKYVMARE